MFSASRTICPYKTFQGVSGSGVRLLRRLFYPPADLAAVPDREADDIGEELELLDNAWIQYGWKFSRWMTKCRMPLWRKNALFSVFLRMLDENALPAEIKSEIRDGNWLELKPLEDRLYPWWYR